MRHLLIKRKKKSIKRKLRKQKQTENVISVDITFFSQRPFSYYYSSAL